MNVDREALHDWLDHRRDLAADEQPTPSDVADDGCGTAADVDRAAAPQGWTSLSYPHTDDCPF
jgi:hypothetical protein